MNNTKDTNNYHVLYFSNFCEHSKSFLDELSKNNLLNNFEKICIDHKNIKLPAFLKEVPTIIIPDHKEPLFGTDAFKWIEWSVAQTTEKTNKIDAYQPVLDSFSESFSNLNDVGNGQSNASFATLDDFKNDKLITDDQVTFGSDGNVDKSYEKMMQERDNLLK